MYKTLTKNAMLKSEENMKFNYQENFNHVVYIPLKL